MSRSVSRTKREHSRGDGSDEGGVGLTRGERTRELLEQAATTPDGPARDALLNQVVEINMAMARQLSARYRGRGIPDDDLGQVACLALVKAVRRYRYAPDRDFMSFAVPTIRGELRRHFRDCGWMIRPPRAVQEAQVHIKRAEAALEQRLGRSPRPSEIAQFAQLDLGLVIEALSANGCFTPTSLETAGTVDDSHPQEWLGETESGFDRAEARAVLEPLLKHVSDREALMLEMRFFGNATQAEIGKAIGATQGQVSRLLSELMARLRDEFQPQDQLRATRRSSARRPAA